MDKKSTFQKEMGLTTVRYESTRPSKEVRRQICLLLYKEIYRVNEETYKAGGFNLLHNITTTTDHDGDIDGWGYRDGNTSRFNWTLETKRGKLIKRIRAEMPKEIQKSDVWGKLGGLLNDANTVQLPKVRHI